MKSDAELHLYLKEQKKQEERKKDIHETKQMLDHFAKLEEGERAKAQLRREQLRQAQAENLRIALLKKNAKQQEHVSQSLKEKQLVDSNAFAAKNLDVR